MNLPDDLSPCVALFIESLLREAESKDSVYNPSEQLPSAPPLSACPSPLGLSV